MKSPDTEVTSIAISALDPAVRAMLAEDLPQQMAAIRTALFEGSLGAAAEMVHSVHGSAAFCRLDALRESAAQLETDLKRNEKDAESISAFERNVSSVLHALEHKQDSE